jgi:hypothetical protein
MLLAIFHELVIVCAEFLYGVLRVCLFQVRPEVIVDVFDCHFDCIFKFELASQHLIHDFMHSWCGVLNDFSLLH